MVVAHGFAGSAKLMAPFGDTLAARGYVVVLLDFAGHGANTKPLDGLQRDLDIAVGHLRGLPDVDPSRIAMVGHSMGASAVTEYAAAHPDIAATVAISLPDSSAVPARLLVLVGALEFPAFHAEAANAASRGAQAIVVPRVEHISILYAQRTHRETAAWLDGALGVRESVRESESPPPSPTRRLSGAGALLLALIVGLYPVGWLLLGPGRNDKSVMRLKPIAVATAAAAMATVAARFLPTNRLPLSVGNYVIGFTLTAGLLMLAHRRPRFDGPHSRRIALATPLLIGYAAVTIAVPLQLGLTHAVPVGPRWWLLLLVWAGFAVVSYADDRLTGGYAYGILTVIGLTGAAVVGLAPASYCSSCPCSRSCS